MTIQKYKARSRVRVAVVKKLQHYNNRYKLTLPTKTFIIVISIVLFLNSPAVPGGMVLNPFIDKIAGKIL